MDDARKQRALATIQMIFREQFLDDRLRITESTTPEDIPEWDSVAQVSLLSAIENAFNVHFTAEDMARIDSVRALLATLSTHGAQC